MTVELSNFAARLRGFIASSILVAADVRRLNSISGLKDEPPHVGCYEDFDALALELFTLQFTHNAAYRKLCEGRGASPRSITHWTRIPTVPTTAFKELELTCLPVTERATVFHSSGTTEQRPSRHFHGVESLTVYEACSLAWFRQHVSGSGDLLILTPPLAQARHSSLVHMFEAVRRDSGCSESAFVGRRNANSEWTLDFERCVAALRAACESEQPLAMLGTAFSFVHLLDSLAEQDLRFQLSPGSCVIETGGYKGRSRSLPKAELHALISDRLSVPASHIVCEYGMSELSSQAYDSAVPTKPTPDPSQEGNCVARHPEFITRHFYFPPWTRAQILSPETGCEVTDGETGLIRVFDLANVFSVMAIQTEDLGIRRGDGFELIGRAELAEPRGCSLMAV